MRWSEPRAPRPIFFGLALITVGVLFLLRELGVLPDIRFWTLVWLGLGAWLFVGTIAGNRTGWFWPLLLLAYGVVRLLRDLEVIDRNFSIWPIAIIAFGVAMILGARRFPGGRDSKEPEIWQPGS